MSHARSSQKRIIMTMKSRNSRMKVLYGKSRFLKPAAVTQDNPVPGV